MTTTTEQRTEDSLPPPAHRGALRAAAPGRGRVQQELATIAVLIRRDLTRFVREKSRVAGALLQPLLFWLVLGSGMSGAFRLPGAGAGGLSYLQYFFPGVVLMVTLFTAIFSTMSVIEDRHSGFLQAVLVAPGSRASVVLGKSLGATIVAFAQGFLFVLLAPFAGFPLLSLHWPLLFVGLGLSCFSLCALGFCVAWWLDSTAGYHVVMSLLLLPMWIVSGAMFPTPASGPIAWVQRANPMTYAVSALRRALHGGVLPAGTALPGGVVLELAVLLGFSLFALLAALHVCYRQR